MSILLKHILNKDKRYLESINNNNYFIFDIAPMLTVLSAIQQLIKLSKINVRVQTINTKNLEPKRL